MKLSQYVLASFGVALLAPMAAASQGGVTCTDWGEECLARLIANPPMLSQDRLPKGHSTGRCLLVVDGVKRISGPCAYRISKGGDFFINGPRQVYDGIDYPKADIMATMISTDYWAEVFKEGGAWRGYGNDSIGSVHGEGDWGTLKRIGACVFNQRVRICLWK